MSAVDGVDALPKRSQWPLRPEISCYHSIDCRDPPRETYQTEFDEEVVWDTAIEERHSRKLAKGLGSEEKVSGTPCDGGPPESSWLQPSRSVLLCVD